MRIAAPVAALALAACASVLLVPTGSALAQPIEEDSAAPEGRSPVFRLTPRAVHYFTTDLDEDDTDSGEVSVSRFGIPASLEIPIGDASTLTFGSDFLYSSYDFSGMGIFDESGDLLADAYELGLSVTWASRVGEHWTYFIGGGGRLSAESGADVSDSLTGRVFGGIGYRFSDRLMVGGGIGISSELDGDVLLVPIITVFYQINDHVKFAAGGGDAAAGRTLGATLTWQPQPDLGVSLTGAWDRREFRLDEDGLIPEGIATDSRVDIVLGLNWAITSNVTFRLEGGVSVAQRYEFQDRDDDEILDTDADPTPFVGGSIGFVF